NATRPGGAIRRPRVAPSRPTRKRLRPGLDDGRCLLRNAPAQGRISPVTEHGSQRGRQETMNIRLIGLGDVGQEVVVACSQYFHSKQIVSLLESKKVVKFTTRYYADTLNNLRGATNNAEAAAC